MSNCLGFERGSGLDVGRTTLELSYYARQCNFLFGVDVEVLLVSDLESVLKRLLTGLFEGGSYLFPSLFL